VRPAARCQRQSVERSLGRNSCGNAALPHLVRACQRFVFFGQARFDGHLRILVDGKLPLARNGTMIAIARSGFV
jgi:hypothetical protein